MLPDTLQDIYESFLIETIDYLSFQYQSDELQEEIQCQVQKSKMNKLREKLKSTDIDLDSSSDELEYPKYDVSKENVGSDSHHMNCGDKDALENQDDGNNKCSSSIAVNPLTNTLIVKKKTINNKTLVKKSVPYKKHNYSSYPSKLKKKSVVYGKKYT